MAAAPLGNPQVAEGEVVLDRVVGIKTPQSGGNLQGHPPIGLIAAGETEVAADAPDMGVHRNYQFAGRDTAPESQVEPVGGPDHPAQIHA